MRPAESPALTVSSRDEVNGAFKARIQNRVESAAGAVALGRGSSCYRRLSPDAGASVSAMAPSRIGVWRVEVERVGLHFFPARTAPGALLGGLLSRGELFDRAENVRKQALLSLAGAALGFSGAPLPSWRSSSSEIP